ncbi:MAG: response regulator [Defluviitaleaceae bacterium]|nr:response regulator [Defluviitaleaceae bacterium]
MNFSQKAEAERHEAAKESNRAKNRFLARMSHEIRTPITAVIGISEIELQNPNLPAHIEASFSKIHTSASALLTIVNDVLDLSKIEAGKMKLFLEEYDVASMIKDITGLYPYFAGSKELDFRLHVSETMPTHLLGDVWRVRQVINNLLSNAFKYTDSGSVDLIWGWDGTNVLATVKDTGSGISKEQVQILQSGDYTRLHKDEGQFTGGPGIGLSIVFSLLDLMNANIKITSRVGAGTTIDVRIPQDTTEKSQKIGKTAAKRLEHFELDALSASKKFSFVPKPMPYGRVLLVDDVEANLFVAKGLLAFYSLNVETCISGYDAIEKVLDGNEYDIIFMDYMMPGLNGMETMNKLRDMKYGSPIVALTANALIGNAEKFISAGFDGFIPKPISTKQLNETLMRFIRNKQTPEVLKAAESAQKISSESLNKFQLDGEVLAKLRSDFVRHRKNTLVEISEALNSGDIKQAHFLSHTLKGSAALIHETTLANAAEVLEKMLNKDEMPPPDALATLEHEFARVIDNIKSFEQPHSDAPDRTDAIECLNTLEPMLTLRKAQCINELDILRDIPEAAVFVRQVENFDFAAALGTLPVLRDILDE